MTNYILIPDGVLLSNKSVDTIWKTVLKQRRSNFATGVLLAALIVCAARLEVRSAVQRGEIDRLQRDVEALKGREGE